MFKRFWSRKTGLPPAAQYPLALTPGQVAALREWRSGAGYDAFQHVIAELARRRLTRLLNTEPGKVEFERGALASLNEVHEVMDIILSTCEVVDDRTRSNGSKRSASPEQFHLGNPLWWNAQR